MPYWAKAFHLSLSERFSLYSLPNGRGTRPIERGHFVHRPDGLRENELRGVPSPKIAITNDAGSLINQQRYMPFGGVRYLAGSPAITNTDFGYTGQRNLDGEIGLMDYKARFYSPTLGKFTQPDNLIPNTNNPQAWSRYSYVLNNPIRYNDPTGHMQEDFMSENMDCSYIDGSQFYCDKKGELFQRIPRKHPLTTPLKQELESPVIWDTGDAIIMVMPPGSNPTMPRSDFSRKLGVGFGIAGLLFDIGEMVGIFLPQIGGEDAAAVADIGVTYLSSAFYGQSYIFEQPHPSGPIMLSVNQDVLFTASDALAAAGAKAVLGFSGGPAGIAAGKGVDVITTGASVAYDYSRVFGSTPNYVTLGISTSFDKTFGNAVIMIWQQP